MRLIIALLLFGYNYTSAKPCDDPLSCETNGLCINATHACVDGWQGSKSQFCGSKIKLEDSSGSLSDKLANYSINATKCSWLIDASNSPITLYLEKIATQCGRGYLHIFDGDSVNSPLLAAFNGELQNNNGIRKIPQVTAKSGFVLIHFYGDGNYTMAGFNITYKRSACLSIVLSDCSGNGFCTQDFCICQPPWYGVGCELPICLNNCRENENRGKCNRVSGCICNSGWAGEDCGQLASAGYWEIVRLMNSIPSGSASHGMVVRENFLYKVGGESFDREDFLYKYNFHDKTWNKIRSESPSSPTPRYAHSTVMYQHKLFIYGGMVENKRIVSEIWSYDIIARQWQNIAVKPETCKRLCGPLDSMGHSATVITNPNNPSQNRIVIIFGYSPKFGYLNTVQEYYFETNEWRIVSSKGNPIKGGYGHSAVWDELTPSKIYVYGGISSKSETESALSKYLYSYDVDSHIWTLLADAPLPRFLHIATVSSPGLMLVVGGIGFEENNSGPQRHISDVFVYDTHCNSWHTLDVPSELQPDLARFGHSTVSFNGSLYIYGGFRGQMLSDMIKYTPGNCVNFSTRDSCLNSRIGTKCIWHRRNNKCLHIQDLHLNLFSLADFKNLINFCPNEAEPSKEYSELQEETTKCEELKDCVGCVQATNNGCSWCGHNGCVKDKCPENDVGAEIKSLDQCPTDNNISICDAFHTCTACKTQSLCKWQSKTLQCVAVTSDSSTAESSDCPRVCSEQIYCQNCTQAGCIWCNNKKRCVDLNAYGVNFPYGQCYDYTTDKCETNENELEFPLN